MANFDRVFQGELTTRGEGDLLFPCSANLVQAGSVAVPGLPGLVSAALTFPPPLRHLERQIELLDAEIAERTALFEKARCKLDDIPGVKGRICDTVLAYIGPNVNPFPSSSAISKWAGVAPGNKTSGGKRLSGRTQPGNKLLRAALVQAAWAATKKKDSYFRAQFGRLAPRLGKKKAILAVAHSILEVIWAVLKYDKPYNNLGVDYFDKTDEKAAARRYISRLQTLGYEVTATKSA